MKTTWLSAALICAALAGAMAHAQQPPPFDSFAVPRGSAPHDVAPSHGVIVGPDRAAWVTDGGLNAIVRVDAKTLAVTRFALPQNRLAIEE